MRILIPSDVFPPRSGGAGWSAHALALALQRRGHQVRAIVPRQRSRGLQRETVLDIETVYWGYQAPNIPFVQNFVRHELAWQPLAGLIASEAQRMPPRDRQDSALLIHAQHVQTCPPAVLAARKLGCPVVVTVRDHWPWDYFAVGLHGGKLPYSRQTGASLATDLPARLGPLRGALALPAIPYMLSHLRRRAAFLAQADAIVAVSAYVARRLEGLVDTRRVRIIPNMVDTAALDGIAATAPATAIDGPFLLFVGKLERNKGADLLIEIIRSMPAQRVAQLPPLLLCGSGPLEHTLTQELSSFGVQVRALGWVEHDEVLRLMARCSVLLFPSNWGDTLSRTLLEASALGAPILAMPTGGTPDIINDGFTGLLAATPPIFAQRLLAMLDAPQWRANLGRAARAAAYARFAVEHVVVRFEQLYREIAQNA